MSHHTAPERIEEEASLWAARLDGGGMTAADRLALDRWLDADPEHRWVLSRYRQLSAQLDAAAEKVAPVPAAAHPRRWLRLGGAVAAAAGVAIFFVVLASRPDTLATKTAERHAAALADGSRVELNAQTDLAVSFRRDERRVKLSRGEALFTVARDPARPFVVETPAGVVRVTGTIFNIRAARRAAGEHVEVTVLEGHVRVRAAGQTAAGAAITPGQQAVLEGAEVVVRPLAEGAAQDVLAWRQGLVVFDDTLLAEALEHFAAYHVRAVAVDAGVARLRLGGRFALDDLEGLLDAIEKVLPVRVEREAGGAVRIVAAGAK